MRGLTKSPQDIASKTMTLSTDHGNQEQMQDSPWEKKKVGQFKQRDQEKHKTVSCLVPLVRCQSLGIIDQ